MPPSVFPAAPRPAEAWPPFRELRVRRSPDWSDYRIYPVAALRRDQEGAVVPQLLVGRDGVPRDCRILQSSGFAELDAGSCELALQMRFARPLDEDGRNVEASYGVRLLWQIADPTLFGSARLQAVLTLDGGAVTECTIKSDGNVPREWRRLACRVLTEGTDYYLRDSRLSAHRATVLIQLAPDGGDATAAETPPGRLVAEHKVEFALGRRRGVHDCRAISVEGFGQPRVDHDTPCGFFLTSAWIRPSPQPEAPREGVFTLRVYVEP